jgi:hypothetical protein
MPVIRWNPRPMPSDKTWKNPLTVGSEAALRTP